MERTAKKGQQASNSPSRRRIASLVLTACLLAASLLIAFPPQDKIHQGLDIQGGLSVVLAANPSDGQEIDAEDMEKAKAIIEERVNALGASEASVQLQGDNQILVQIPGLSDSAQALATIGKTGVLEFARLDSFSDETVRSNIDSGNIIDYASIETPEGDAPTGALDGLMDTSSAKNITVPSGTYTPMFTGDHITSVTIGRESDASQYYSVNIRLDSEASSAFADASTALLPTNGKIVILLDGEVNSAPAVQSAITTGEVAITGNYTLEDAKSLQTVLDSGSLPVSFTYEQSTTVGPTLGQGELSAGIMSMIIGIIVVMLYLLAFYRGFGLIPAANMVVFFVIYMGVLGALSAAGLFSLSLAGIAGIILSIGMTADSVILAIERFKEELKEGRTIKAASEKGVRHAIITSLDADVVSLISALCLFFLATSSIKGFGLTLALGILCDILVMLVFVAPAIRLLAGKSMRFHPAFWGIAYAQELGDVRTGAAHYMLPAEAKEKAESERHRARERRNKEKSRAKAAKERDKSAEKRARESQRERKEIERAAKREKLEEIKREDAKRDEERRRSRKDARKRQVKGIDGTPEEVAADESAVLPEKAEQRDDIAARSSKEVADILSELTGGEVPDEEHAREELPENMIETGPSEDVDPIGVEMEKRTAGPVASDVPVQPYKNRTQRRAEAKAAKKSKKHQ